MLGMLRAKLQEEGLRTYLLAYGRFYSSLSIAQLCDMFELGERKVGGVVGGCVCAVGDMWNSLGAGCAGCLNPLLAPLAFLYAL